MGEFFLGLAVSSAVYLALDVILEKLNPSHQTVGGIRFFRLGRLRLSFCVAKAARAN